ncbi:Fe-S cluster assembly protein SufD [Priestia megaterium]|jgi:Fe-S cluster assembly protein SufD|uniref:FeS assembly protein SufD n=1 Tax=Priestia megaterium (strain ATCC 14581 / DSM 32 / CCUG 1817 / JCM 2506 / NBRC 15308 / NCIMB 9376 / NCTC 10342 / NRRL B-14308 / VKM B-512 / Ford 19) TaxID=1348623 RepID=A0A0B6AN83_PRIM2|nr:MULTISPECIES: Fe-S cluster assembly protein SufD [Priestia]AJI24931.1 FeS assembly protein SufD [Priestia megaterium NBRC 15308 = ATCC 14581]KFN06705.1 FeS assembly protein SufD [Priestia megaterium]KGJ85555.1 Fe-S cluster assembly protein SufD [Priestia megaterium NBRC 15308 = ATCC 14581]MBU8755249.1 Fe-S cluster assembly protein SufD [Priestia megaterium]MCU7711753.1 Fe-S cluster assembly protein SufD [Priestia megaterium]
MTIDTKLPFDQEYISSFSKEANEPSWLLDLRLQALAKAEDLALPKPDKTNISKWNFTAFDKHTSQASTISSVDELPEVVKALIDTEAVKNLYVQRDQTAAYSTLTEELKSQGVIFTDIQTAAKEHSDLVEKYFMKDGVKVDEHRLTALNAALLNGGVFVYVPKNVEIQEPLQAVFVREDEEAALFNHVIVVAEDNSSVTYVENYIATAEESNGVVNIVTEVFANSNAKVTFGAVDYLAKGTTTYVNRRGVAGKDGRIEWALGLMSEGNTVSENTTYLMGDGSYGDTKTVTVGRGEQSQNLTTSIVHFGKHSEGYILKHGVMKESASSIFNGIGKIEHGASKSNAEQESRVLMLSEKARGDANPILLIDEDDVTAGHAASVGRVDPIQLYYLMSRGIPQTEAERLVIHGFLAPVVNELPIETVKKQLTDLIERKVR